MAKPTPRADLVRAVADAAVIVNEAIPVNGGMIEDYLAYRRALQCAAMPVIVRELLDTEVDMGTPNP